MAISSQSTSRDSESCGGSAMADIQTTSSSGRSAPEPIAIIGASCRLPGDVSSLESFWHLLQQRKSGWSEFPESRFRPEGFHNANGNGKLGTTNTAGGHFLNRDMAVFDSDFFGIHAMEAKAMDPQQRLLLEVAYEAFESASLSLDDMSGSKTGVYVGQWTSDYHDMLTRDLESTPTYLPLGTGPAIASNRISYFFNLEGPSFTLDTGCSASLVALHQAVQGLRAGDAEQSFVAGVNLTLDPHRYSYMSKVNMFSKEGKSFPFDARANGYGRGEGCSGVLLQPLSLALKQNRPIRAIIRNTACNQDGRTSGITVPSAAAQMAAIRKAYADAGLEPYADYVEAHGTGTRVGDPIEAKAISAALASGRDPSSPLPIGSVKGNVGHLESAAGVTGLVKAMLMLEHNEIPPQLNSEQRSPAVALEKLNLRIALEPEKVPLRRISVNSFGYGGTNAHVILESSSTLSEGGFLENGHTNGVNGTKGHINGAHGTNGANGPSKTNGVNGITNGNGIHHAENTNGEADSPREDALITNGAATPTPRLFVLSAATEKSCQKMSSNLADYLEQQQQQQQHSADEDDLLDRLALTLHRRSVMSYRMGFVSAAVDDLGKQLREASEGPVQQYNNRHGGNKQVGFVFSGQGAQYAQMGQDLITRWPRFAASLEQATKCVKQCGGSWDLLEELSKPAEQSRVSDPELSQPLTTAVQLALVDALGDLGVKPAAVAGHSSGEIAAAYGAGLISFEEAMTVSFHRGRLASEVARRSSETPGAMLAVGASPEVVEDILDRQLGDVQPRPQIACYNSPSSVTVSGDVVVLQKLQAELDEQSIFNRLLRTGGVAYHSRQMALIEDEYRDSLPAAMDESSSSAASAVMVSSVTGGELARKALNRDYWVRNMLSPVRFTYAVTKLSQLRPAGGRKLDMIIEIGPHFQLVGPVKQTLRSLGSDAASLQCIGTLKRGKDAQTCMLEMLHSLWSQGITDVFHRVNSGFAKPPAVLTNLPPYPFDHSKTYWHETRVSREYRLRDQLPHELLGTMAFEHNPFEPRWRLCLRLDDIPWLKGHRVQGETVFPASGYLAIALQAIHQHTRRSNRSQAVEKIQLRDVSLSKALVLNGSKNDYDLELFTTLRPQTYSAKRSSDVWMEFRIFSATGTGTDGWSEHCRGLIRAIASHQYSEPLTGISMERDVTNSGRSVSPKKFYFLSKDTGLDWTSPFDGMQEIHIGGDEAVSSVSPTAVEGQNGEPQYIVHPATLDTCLFQTIASILLLEDGVKTPFVPTFIKSLTFKNPAQEADRPKDMVCSTKTTAGERALTFDTSTAEKDSPDNVLFEARGITVSELPGLGNNAAGGDREFCHSVEWVTHMPSVTDKWIRDQCHSMLEKGSISELVAKLDAITLSILRRVVNSTQREQVPDNHMRYWYDWMKTTLSARQQDAPEEELALELPGDNDNVAIRMLQRISPHLDDILRGTVEPLALLTQDDLLSEIYVDEASTRCHDQIARFCKEIGRQTPDMKILEVGAGTASVSRRVLDALQEDGRTLASEYVFTDISAGHFKAAQEKLADYDHVVKYQALDIEKDHTSQGLEPRTFDVVIASNVIHATSSIGQSLNHIRSLLKPGGRLILMELTRDVLHLSLVFGALPGWWSGYAEGRTLSPLLSAQDWSSKLRSHGFANTEAPLFRDYDPEDGGCLGVFVGTAEDDATTPSAAENASLDVVTSSPTDPDTLRLVEELKQHLPQAEFNLREPSSPAAQAGMSIILPDIAAQSLNGIEASMYESIKSRIINSKAVLLITRADTDPNLPPTAGWAAGFCRSFRLESPEVRLVQLELENGDLLSSTSVDAIATVLKDDAMNTDIPASAVDMEFRERDGQLTVPRIKHQPAMSSHIHQTHGNLDTIQAPFSEDRAMFVETATPGLIDTLRWTDDEEATQPLHPDYIKLKLSAASVNFKEVLIAGGHLEGMTKMLNDCSGVVVEVGENMRSRYSPGDRVCAANAKSYANFPVVHGDCSVHIPEKMSFEVAASVPVVWVTSYYAVMECGRLQKGERILVHSAAGAVGQAVVKIAQHIGAEVFATCGSDEKREFLVKELDIPEDHIFSSRTTGFRDGIDRITDGQGVDVVINSLSGEMLRESCNVLAPFGRFVEIGRKDLMEDALMPMEFLLKNITFSYIDLSQISMARPTMFQRLLRGAMSLLESETVSSVMITERPISEIADAFRALQGGKHIGKIILTVGPDQHVKAVRPRPSIPKLRPDATYMITGGLGGLGKQIALWLASRGARHIVVMSRSGAVDDEARMILSKLQAGGVKVVIKRCDISSESHLQTALGELKDDDGMPPVRGLIQSAMVLRDALFADMDGTQWSQAMQPKSYGSWNLHRLLGTEMDFFVFLSSGVAVTGNVGQCNYAAGCSFQDALAHHRTRMGLAAHSINVGAVKDVGFVSENVDVAMTLRRQGLGIITMADFLAHLDQVVNKQDNNGAAAAAAAPSLPCQSVIGLEPAGDEIGLGRGAWLNDRKFAFLNGQSRNSHSGNASGASDAGVPLSEARTVEDAAAAATEAILEQLGKTLGIERESLSASRSLSAYGVDSLVSMELRKWISVSLKANVSLLAVRGSSSIAELGQLVVKESKLTASLFDKA